MYWLDLVAWTVAVLASVPFLVLLTECGLALWRPEPRPLAVSRTPRTVILIPAHNEGEHLLPTLRSAQSQMEKDDRLVVVADNCTDHTAEFARQNGAYVIERHDPDRRGKGFALAFGRDSLINEPPDVVLVLDADCLLGPDAARRITTEALMEGRPAQAAYRMTAPPGAGPNTQVAAFAFLVKNVIRPLGLRRLGGPCSLTGTGMAFPWAVFRDAPLAHGHIVEDMGLTVDLAVAGLPPVFVPEAEVRGEFPVSDSGTASQRRRWEHGHLSVIRDGVPRLLGTSIRRGRPGLALLALDLGIPPLSALVTASFGILVVLIGLGLLTGSRGPTITLGSTMGLTALVLFAIWVRFGRGTITPLTLIYIPWYAFRKIGLYLDFLIRPQRGWVRTERTTTMPTDSAATGRSDA